MFSHLKKAEKNVESYLLFIVFQYVNNACCHDVQVRLILRRSDESPPSGRRRPHHHHHHPHTVRRLMRLILEQGETISEQLRRLGERDSQIENLEQRTHRERVKTLGSNYLVDSYLGEDSGVVSDLTPAATPQDDEDNFADESDDAASQHGEDFTCFRNLTTYLNYQSASDEYGWN